LGFGTLKGFEILFAKALRSSLLHESEEELPERTTICSSIGNGWNARKMKQETQTLRSRFKLTQHMESGKQKQSRIEKEEKSST
jgi:hypothetical protein